MEVEKSLVYFLAALKGNDTIIKKLFRLPAIKRFEEDEELLEDLIIENNQAIETTELHQRILESITTSYASLLSNDMNTIMKTLTLFTVLLTLPTLVFSFFGMNVPLPIDDHSYISWIIVVGISALLGITEPAMFGVNLKLRYPFIGAIVGSGIGSAYIAFFKVKAIALGTAGLPGFISINPVHAGWLHYFVGMTISFIVAITVTLILSKRKANKEVVE